MLNIHAIFKQILRVQSVCTPFREHGILFLQYIPVPALWSMEHLKICLLVLKLNKACVVMSRLFMFDHQLYSIFTIICKSLVIHVNIYIYNENQNVRHQTVMQTRFFLEYFPAVLSENRGKLLYLHSVVLLLSLECAPCH